MGTPRAELIHIDVDRRLGHEWDEWDGKPLPNAGNFDAPGWLFLGWIVVALATAFAVVAVAVYLLAPRLAGLNAAVPHLLWWAFAALGAAAASWWIGITLSFATGRALLPGFLAERGVLLRVMRLTSRVANRFGQRDRVENAAVKIYNVLALRRAQTVGKGELLLLIPRCLSRATLDDVLQMAGRYGVPVFVATRGQLARRVIRERRPRAVVAVACERDMVSGLHDVAAKLPVLGLTMTLPAGPCKDAVLDMITLERYLQAFVA
ncbi:MAG TPA: DUF116 domain-containing protein [Gemmatimonadales bacterium]|nr:DUF116 domain-containing protein [Gemmatimonadales bacterium]